MKPLICFILISQVSAYQTQYLVHQENITVNYFDEKSVNTFLEVYPFNKSVNALNASIFMKRDIPDNTKLLLTASRWFRTDYKINLIHIEKSVVDVMQMDSFGIETLCMHYFRPPLVWPLKKGVTYRSVGWIPDSTKFPPNLPEGRYKVNFSYEYVNKSVIAKTSWFIKIVYK